MNLVIWDIESAGNEWAWSSILEIGGLLVNQDFKELDRFNFRCRIPEGEIPQAQALLINRTNLNLLTKTNLSKYSMLNEVEKIFKKWSPAVFLGWSNCNFDDPMIQHEFFRGLRYPYLTNSSPNKRHDGMKIAQGAYAVNNNIFKTENTAKGNVSMRLESIARMNGIKTEGAHSALVDSELVAKVLSLTKKKQPNTWDSFLQTSSRSDVETIIKRDKIFTLQETHFGKFYLYLVAPLHPKACIHEIYRWGICVDLKIPIEPFLDLSISDLKIAIKKKKFLKQVQSNKAPIILDESYGKKQEPYSSIDPELLKKRAELVKSNEKFSRNVLVALREIAEEKIQTKTQEDVYAEETLYSRFSPTKDTALFPAWHTATWKDKLQMLSKFSDDRLINFGQKIIFQESPETLPKDIIKKIQMDIAKRILSEENQKWWTCKEFYHECDNLRSKAEDNNDEKKLKFLDEINEYVMSIQKKYENA